MYLAVILLVHLSYSLVAQAKPHHVSSSPIGVNVNSNHRSTSSANFVPRPAKPLHSPIKRSSSAPSMFIAAPGNMASASTNQPSLVAIPLYFRNDRISAQRTPLLYEMFMSALSDSNRIKAPLAAVSSTNFPIKFDPIASSPLKPEAKYTSKLTNSQTLYSQLPSSPSTSYMRPSSINEPSYDESSSQGIAAAAYAAASPHSHLNMAAGYGKGKPVSGDGAKVLRNPGLRPVAFDDHQKSAFHDFTGALEQYDLKPLTNSDLHSLPHIAPGDLTGHSVTSKKSSSGGPGYDSGSGDYGQSGGSSYGGGQSYGGSSGGQSYGGGQSSGQSYGGSSGGQSYGGSSGGDQSYGGSSGGGQSYGGSSGGQSYGGGSSEGYGSSSGNAEYDPTGYGYSVPSPKTGGGYGQSGSSGTSGYGSSGSSQGYSQQSSGGGSHSGGQSGGSYDNSGPEAPPAYMSAYPVENNFGAEVHAAYRESGSPVPYTSAGNPFGDVSGQSGGGSGGGSDYGASASSSYSYDTSPTAYSNPPQSSSYGSTDDAYSSSSASSQTYTPSSYASSGQSPVSASRVYSSINYALASPVSSSGNQMYSLSSVENQVTGERSLRNQQQQSASPSFNSNSYSSPSFYPIASVSGSGSYGSSASYTSKLIPKASNNYEKSVVNDYYADPDCPRENEYNSGSSPVSSSIASSSSSPSQGSSAYASTGKSSQISENSYSLGSSSQNGAKGVISSAIQAYEPEELDPSKLDLKIVHLPVSVLKKLVSSGDVALGNQQLYSSN